MKTTGSTTITMNNNTFRYQDPVIALVEHKNCKFLITNQPTNKNMKQYVQKLNEHNVSAVVRVCEPTYGNEEILKNGMQFYELYLDDGGYPSPDKEDEWFKILTSNFKEDPEKPVVVHCASGLGRAPVLVCIALMDLGMKFEDAVELIRTKRRGAINSKQLNYLKNYRAKSRLKSIYKKNSNSCTIQ